MILIVNPNESIDPDIGELFHDSTNGVAKTLNLTSHVRKSPKHRYLSIYQSIYQSILLI
jgi:hypothetical protein